MWAGSNGLITIQKSSNLFRIEVLLDVSYNRVSDSSMKVTTGVRSAKDRNLAGSWRGELRAHIVTSSGERTNRSGDKLPLNSAESSWQLYVREMLSAFIELS